jgi:hypothetical protein
MNTSTQKFLRIFLFVLILIGVAALLTRDRWVPKLVAQIIARDEVIVIAQVQTREAQNTVQGAQPNVTLVDGRQCYTYSHAGTTTEPYTTNEFIDMVINGTKVTGTKRGTQAGPDMTNGYTGTISGTLDNNTIIDTYSYTIEGSPNKEKEIYHAGKTGIEKLRYPLMERSGMLVPDMTKEYSLLPYARVGCEASN